MKAEKAERMNVKDFLDSRDMRGILEEVRADKDLLKKLIADATHADTSRMLRLFRETEYHYNFLQLLSELPIEVWSEHHLQADYLVEELDPEEKKWVLRKYWDAAELKENPIATLLLLPQD